MIEDSAVELETMELVEKDEEPVVKNHHQDHYYWKWVRPLAVEFITSMILIFNVCSLPWPATHQMLTSENKTFQNLPLDDAQEMPLMPAFTAGLSVFALLTMFHYVSVAHISPTVTFGFALGGCFDFKMVIPYILTARFDFPTVDLAPGRRDASVFHSLSFHKYGRWQQEMGCSGGDSDDWHVCLHRYYGWSLVWRRCNEPRSCSWSRNLSW